MEIVEYPDFGQGTALAEDQVDAATGFAINEPVAMELQGIDVNVLHVDDTIALPGPGLILSGDPARKTLLGSDRWIGPFVAATLRAMREIAADPEVGVEAAVTAVPELAESRATQRAILDATIAVWTPPGGSADDFGRIDSAGWQASLDYMTTLGLVPNPVKVENLVSNAYLPAG